LVADADLAFGAVFAALALDVFNADALDNVTHLPVGAVDVAAALAVRDASEVFAALAAVAVFVLETVSIEDAGAISADLGLIAVRVESTL
jgi:hypothetical protein